jgi:hypothetical protein
MSRTALKTTGSRTRPKTNARRRRSLPAGLSPEFLYLTQNARELEAYAGEVLLIQGSRLVAHSADMFDILKAIQKHGIRAPFIFRVPAENQSVFL